jgi:hypothetical protein
VGSQVSSNLYASAHGSGWANLGGGGDMNGAARKLERDAESRGKIEMNQLIRVHREWAGDGAGEISETDTPRQAEAGHGPLRTRTCTPGGNAGP